MRRVIFVPLVEMAPELFANRCKRGINGIYANAAQVMQEFSDCGDHHRGWAPTRLFSFGDLPVHEYSVLRTPSTCAAVMGLAWVLRGYSRAAFDTPETWVSGVQTFPAARLRSTSTTKPFHASHGVSHDLSQVLRSPVLNTIS